VKCNPDLQLLRLLAALGTGFDCASTAELELVLSLGVAPTRIIFANPCKSPASIVFARRACVHRMTFDNADELRKIHRLFPSAQLLLRIWADDASALVRLGDKFGAPPSSVPELLRLAMELGLSIVGVGFHIGACANRRSGRDGGGAWS
jgi:ornithine decarboxylase